eukprot:evm.model.scf_660EXC.7 EVM.evm.TU.scf_660EXC.7   scf_660EXC:65740-66012(+)
MADVAEDEDFEAGDKRQGRPEAQDDAEIARLPLCNDSRANNSVRATEGRVDSGRRYRGGSQTRILQTIGTVRRNGRSFHVINNWQGQVAWL